MIAYGIDILRKYIPKALTFCEAYTLLGISSYYCMFFVESIVKRKVHGFLVGLAANTVYIFTPVSIRTCIYIVGRSESCTNLSLHP